MDYPAQRLKYLNKFNEYLDKLVLNEKLLASLRQCFAVSMEAIETLNDEISKKTFILLELTKNRFSCSQVIKLLRESEDDSNATLAQKLDKINTSPGRQHFGDDIEIAVTPTTTLDARGQESQVYPMTRKPRGKALIVNNVKELVQRESQRFEHIFKQLLFEVKLAFDLTANEVINKVKQLRDQIQEEFEEGETEDKPQAVIVMVISHGMDEKILGRKALTDNDLNDQVPIKNIVDIFAEEELEFDEQFVKLFVFTCCRLKTKVTKVSLRDISYSFTSEADNSKDTAVFYSSAEGFETFVDDKHYYSYFGKYLSESIAQYAYKEDLAQILNRTTSGLRDMWGGLGYFSPEFRAKALKSSVYFNPHYFVEEKDEDNDDDDEEDQDDMDDQDE